MSRKYGNARDRAGRTLLHYAIQHSHDHVDGSVKGHLTADGNHNSLNDNGDIILQDINLTHIDSSISLDLTDTTQLHNKNRGRKCIITEMKNAVKKKPCFLRFCTHSSFTPDYFGIIKYLVQEYPSMLGATNNVSYQNIFFYYCCVLPSLGFTLSH